MVFSVIGDTDSFVPTTWPTAVFQMALIEAARNGGGKNMDFIFYKVLKVLWRGINDISYKY